MHPVLGHLPLSPVPPLPPAVRGRVQYSNMGGLQHSTVVNGQMNQTETEPTTRVIFTMYQMHLITTDLLSPRCRIHICSSMHAVSYTIDHMRGHKASLNKCKRIEIIPRISSDHQGTKLESNNSTNSSRHANTWRLETHCRVNSGLQKKSKGK